MNNNVYEVAGYIAFHIMPGYNHSRCSLSADNDSAFMHAMKIALTLLGANFDKR